MDRCEVLRGSGELLMLAELALSALFADDPLRPRLGLTLAPWRARASRSFCRVSALVTVFNIFAIAKPL